MADSPNDPNRTVDPSAANKPADDTPIARGNVGGAGQTIDQVQDAASPGGSTVDAPANKPLGAGQTRAGLDSNQDFVVDIPGATGVFSEENTPMHTEGFDAARSARMQRKLENVKIPGYEVLSELGHGGMGVVYKARDTRLERTVALKMVLSGIHASDSQLARFVHEAKAVAQFQHPNIVQIYEINEAEGVPYFSLEFVDGGSLDQKIDHKPQSPQFAANMLETIAQAMQYAHDRNIVHRDLKPGNILLTRSGAPKIADFGLAKKLDDSSRTQAGDIMGTPNYMAPEQARGDIAAIGPLSDQFALGAMLYELLTGRQPFSGASIMKTIEQVLTQDPVPPSQLVPGTPRDIETICIKCLQKDPAKRYANCSELAEDLRRFQRGELIKARPVSSWERTIRWCRRNPVVASLTGAAAVLLIAVTAVSSVFAVTVNEKNNALRLKNIELDKAAQTEHALNVLANNRLEESRSLIHTLVNDIPAWLAGAVYSEKVRQYILERLDDFKSKAEEAQADDRHLAARAEEGRLIHHGELMVQQRNYNKAIEDFRKAVQIAEEVLADNPTDKDKSAANLAAALASLGDAHLLKKDLEHGCEFLERSLTIRRRLVESPQTGELRPSDTRKSLGITLEKLADIFLNRGLVKDATSYANEAIAVFDAIPRAEMAPDARQSAAAAHRDLGRAKFQASDAPGGRKEIDRAIADFRDLIKDQPLNLSFQRYLAFVESDAGDTELMKAKDATAARQRYEDAIAIRRVLAEPAEVTNFRRDLAGTLYRAATAALAAGDRAGADREYGECLAIRQSLAAASPNDGSLKFEVMLALARCGKYAEAAEIASRFEIDANTKFKDQPTAKVILLRRVGFGFGLCAAAIAHGQAGTLPDDLQKLRQSYMDRALKALENAVATGYRDIEELSTDPDFDPLRNEQRFAALIDKLNKK